jgi:calcineurin-like phosphoesterase family protein
LQFGENWCRYSKGEMVSQVSFNLRSNKIVVAIGDLHGHYPALDRLLADLRRYDLFEHSDPDKLRRGVTLVFTGDYIDRGDHALAIIEKLRKIGATNPGHLVTLLGNHELLALEGYDKAKELSEWDNEEDAIAEYRNDTCHGMNGGDHFISEFGQYTLPALKSYAARMARNGDIGSWMRGLSPFFETTVARKKILFMHADLTERLRDRTVLDRYLRQVRELRHVGTPAAGGTRAKYGNQLLMSSRSIFWSRSFRELEDADQKSIDDICKNVQVDFLVTGHTPHQDIKVYGNRIFDIDVGMTPKCGGNTPRALMFRSDGIVGFGVDGSETPFVRW